MNNIKKIFRERKAVTLAELVIVIGIIGVLTAIFGGAYRSQQTQVNFNNALSKVVTTIQTARNYAVTSRSTQLADGSLKIPPAGYGVYIERSATLGQSKVILFANISDSGNRAFQYDNDGPAGNPVDDITEETYILPKDIDLEEISGINLLPDGTKQSNAIQRTVIIFTPPLADAYVAQNGLPNSGPFTNPPTQYDELLLRFSRPGTPGNTAGKDATDKSLHFDATAGFAELEL